MNSSGALLLRLKGLLAPEQPTRNNAEPHSNIVLILIVFIDSIAINNNFPSCYEEAYNILLSISFYVKLQVVYMSSQKVAVVLFNLGGPNSLEAVQPFLFNLFNDPCIINAPRPIRYLLAQFISRRRNKKAQKIYSVLGGASPIVPQTEAQAMALEAELQAHGSFKVFYAMRYWHPMAPEVVAEVRNFNPDRVILLPLYPQFSDATSASSIEDWRNNAGDLNEKEVSVCCYPTEPGFIRAYVELIKPVLANASAQGKTRLLFSAHGLPVKNIKKGDPYQWQIEQSVAAIVKSLNVKDLDYKICYQSRVGLLEWLSPYTDEEIAVAGRDGVSVVLVPIAFVSEHSETLVELDVEYKELAEECGVPGYFRVPTVTTHPQFISGLASLCLQSLGKSVCIRKCPDWCKKCFCNVG